MIREGLSFDYKIIDKKRILLKIEQSDSFNTTAVLP